MAQLAKCPQCEHELLAPDGVASGAWVRCPSCRAFFQLSEASSREITPLEVIESADDSPSDDIYTKQTVADLSTSATWVGQLQEQADAEAAHLSEAADLHIADEPEEDEAQSDDDSNFDDFEDMFAGDEHAADPVPAAEEFAEHEEPLEATDLHVADIRDEAIDPGALVGETPEAAAERIDAWFRSVKTLADVPPLPASSSDELLDRDSEHQDDPATSDMHIATDKSDERAHEDAHELSDDFELNVPLESPRDVAAWDDSQHMDRLLAELEDRPADEYVPTQEYTSAIAPEIAQDEHAEHNEREEVANAPAEWTPDESYSMTSKNDEPRRKKSVLRTMVFSAVGGLMGLGLGYYVLLWLRGPEIDFLEAAKYLPKAVLPASFSKSAPRLVEAPVPTTAETPVSPADESTETAKATSEPGGTPAEKTAAFSEPADAKSHVAEPAAFNAPNAAPLTQHKPTEMPHIKGTPAFTEADLSAAIQAGKDAEPGLVNGSLSDGTDVGRKKGFSYSILADLAQKSLFVNSGPSAVTLQQEADDVFRQTLATSHAREEVAQIVPKWIGSTHRRQGGVFFACNVFTQQPKGTVIESNVDLGAGTSLTLLVPAAVGEQLSESKGPVAVVGWIVDDPAKNVAGYTGTAPQAIVADKLIPLE